MRDILTTGFAAVIVLYDVIGLSATAAHLHHHENIIDRAFHPQQASSGSSLLKKHLALVKREAPYPGATETECATSNCSLTEKEEVDPIQSSLPVVSEIHINTINAIVSDVATPTRRRPSNRVSSPSIVAGQQKPDHDDEWLTLDLIKEVAEYFRLGKQRQSLQGHVDDETAQLELRANHNSHHRRRAQGGAYQSFQLGDSPQPFTTISAEAAGASDLCPAGNGTTFKSKAGISYQVLCNIDFPGHDFPFVKAGSLEECILRCDVYNWFAHGVECLAGIFVPSRVNYDNDCYLKSSVDNPTFTTFEIHGLVRLSAIKSVTSRSAEASSTSASPGPSPSSQALTSSAITSTTSSPQAPATSLIPTGNEPGVTYAAGDGIIEPKVAAVHLHGPTVNKPTNQYIDVTEPEPITLATNLLQDVANSLLTSKYGIAPQTGVLSLNTTTQSMLSPIKGTPHLSRDGGSGGYLNGQHLFVFCDTGTYTSPTAQTDGDFLGFVSSSVAVDTGMNGLFNQPIYLKDGIGQWSGDSGRQRGFGPLTEGELAYNLKMQGDGQRYAIWPEAPILPLDATRGIIIAPIVWDDVDFRTRKFDFTYTGSTLLTITADNKAGPVAERTVSMLFTQNEVEWGCSGGIRSWGPSGVGGTDGYVYIFGNIKGGILLARTTTQGVSDRNSYEYWQGDSWTKQMLTDNSDAFFIEGVFMDVSVFYSPRHLTFIIVYLTTYADNTFYYRYLLADHAIRPHYAPGGEADTDYVENIYRYQWSKERFLYQAPKSLSGKYIYAGAVHAGYFGSNDITNGGTRMLLSWTAPTGQKPESQISEYQIITAGVDWV